MLDQAAQAIARKLEPQEQAVRERVKTVLQQ
jgi:hypothetical protein